MPLFSKNIASNNPAEPVEDTSQENSQDHEEEAPQGSRLEKYDTLFSLKEIVQSRTQKKEDSASPTERDRAHRDEIFPSADDEPLSPPTTLEHKYDPSTVLHASLSDVEDWNIDASPSQELSLYIDDLMTSCDESIQESGDEFQTRPNITARPEEDLQCALFAAIYDVSEPCCLEVFDARNQVFARLLVHCNHISCGVFLEDTLAVSPVPSLEETFQHKLHAMASHHFDAEPWAHDASWDWSKISVSHQDHEMLNVCTAHALKNIFESPRASEAYVRVQPTPWNEHTLPSFSLVELSLALEAFHDQGPRDEPVHLFYQKYSKRSQMGGISHRGIHLSEALYPTRMVIQYHAVPDYHQKSALCMASEEIRRAHVRLGFLHKNIFQISIVEDGFWIILSSDYRVAMLRFPLSLMGMMYKAAQNIYAETEYV